MLATKLRVLTGIARIKGQKPSICTTCAGLDKVPRWPDAKVPWGRLLVVGIEIDLGGNRWFLNDFFKPFNPLL